VKKGEERESKGIWKVTGGYAYNTAAVDIYREGFLRP